VNILGSFAEFERELIADRTRRGRRHKVEVRQQFLGSIPPYGFKYVPRSASSSGTGILEILPEEAAMVRQMYRWVDQDESSIARVVVQLNETGVPPRKRGRNWQKSSVRRILRSEIYAGVWHYNKHRLCEPRRQRQDRRYPKSERTSLRLRPKSEWLPVILPEQLRIVNPGQWRRVQEQLNRNVSFSPRNAKHVYLLAGLVRCGGCQAAYVGEPGHGRFAYRCSKRCKKHGTIAESSLNLTVWNAVSEAFQSPDVIAEAITVAGESTKALPPINSEKEEIGRGMEQIDTEESRVLHAYRLEILSPEQLARELEAFRARRMNLQSRKSALDRESQPKAAFVRRSLEEYCQVIAGKLATLGWEKRQRLLRLLLRSVIFEGDQVRIRGIIPLSDNAPSAVDPAEANATLNTGRIASTSSKPYARNVAEQSTEAMLQGDDSRGTLSFELVRTVERDETAAKVASLANLIKANAALKRKREAN